MDAIKSDQSCIPAEIIFKPTCSSCEKQLNLLINYEEEIEEIAEAKPLAHKNYTITPSHCPFCGKRFNRIAIPTKLPYDNRKMKYDCKPQCNHCIHYEGVLGVQGHAPCSLRNNEAVLWDEWCPGFKIAIINRED